MISEEAALWEEDGTREKKRNPGMRDYVVGIVKYSKDFVVCCTYILRMPAVHLVSYPIP
jgi:hypothetical protein